MPLSVLPFPNVDPVAISLGPFAIRWYALAYIAGILLGWISARRIIANERCWGGPAPFKVTDYDDFVLWITVGMILSGRTGYVLFYNLDHFIAHPAEIVQVWKGGMSFHGGFLGCVLAVVLFSWKRGLPLLSLGDVTCAVGPIGLFFGRLANLVNGELWGRPTDVSWAIIFPGREAGPFPRHPSQLYEAMLEGLVLFVVLTLLVRAGALRRPGLITGTFAIGYAVARSFCELFREPDVQLGFWWRHDNGHAAIRAPVARGHRIHRGCAASPAARQHVMADSTPLEAKIRRLISLAGPMPVAKYMAHCLSDPDHGYYTTQDPLGREGDFITAPEISQMFGELIGLWAAAVWHRMDAPASVRLIELGPGRGTMIKDILRAAHVMPQFREALAVHLVEKSPILIERQKETLADQDVSILWHDTMADVPDGPAIIVANEFFDALPVHQAVKKDDGWHERVVGIDDAGKLAFRIAADPLKLFEQTLPATARAAAVDAIYEWRGNAYALEVGRRVVRGGGAALIIDYGHTASDVGDTLQAVRAHRKSDPLAEPGLTDITAHVDFQALGTAAESIGARVHGPIEQAVLLRRLGIEQRAANLKKAAPPDKANDIDAALGRLMAGGPTGMGTMFKAIGLSSPRLETLPGFEV